MLKKLMHTEAIRVTVISRHPGVYVEGNAEIAATADYIFGTSVYYAPIKIAMFCFS
jgi:hypothetical protein